MEKYNYFESYDNFEVEIQLREAEMSLSEKSYLCIVSRHDDGKEHSAIVAWLDTTPSPTDHKVSAPKAIYDSLVKHVRYKEFPVQKHKSEDQVFDGFRLLWDLLVKETYGSRAASQGVLEKEEDGSYSNYASLNRLLVADLTAREKAC